MTIDDWIQVLTRVGVIVGAVAAILGYFKTRRVDEVARTVNYHVNGRFEDLLVENRRLREVIAADTSTPNAVELVEKALEQEKQQPERGWNAGNP